MIKYESINTKEMEQGYGKRFYLKLFLNIILKYIFIYTFLKI